MNKLIVVVLTILLLPFGACKKDATTAIISDQRTYILNEGNFQFGNASISILDLKNNSVSNDVFYHTNHFRMGDVAQSMVKMDSLLYVVLNNSAKITALNCNQQLLKQFDISIPGGSPRYFQAVNASKAYVTELYANKIWIVDLLSKTVTGSITVNGWTEDIHLADGKVFVAQRKKYSGPNAAAVLVLNPASNSVIQTIPLPSDPSGLVVNETLHQVYVSCEAASAPAKIYTINSGTLRIADSIELPSGVNPRLLRIKSTGDLFFTSGAVYRVRSQSKNPEVFLADHSNQWYGMDVDPVNGDVYLSDALDFVQASRVYRYDSSANVITTFTAGINANNFLFVK